MNLSATQHRMEPRRVLFDVSFTCTSGKMSGIERVVRSLLREGEAAVERMQHEHGPIEFVPVFAANGHFYRWNAHAQAVLAQVADVERDCLGAAPTYYRQLARLLCRCLPHSGVRRSLMPPSGHLGILKPWYRRWKKYAVVRAAEGQAAVQISSDDILWLPDAYWAQPSVWSAVERARIQGALVASLVYDLIPLRSGQANPGFSDYLQHLLAQSDVALCISECERQSLLAFQTLSANSSIVCRDFRTIALGCEFQQVEGAVRSQFANPFDGQFGQADAPSPPNIDSLVHGKIVDGNTVDSSLASHAWAEPVYLCVNTFDPRKNHAYLLDVFDRLWAAGSIARLCLVGRVGWECKPILQRIAAHEQLNRRLFVFHDATDAEVNYCYARARAVITASKDEGFGLPVVESLSRGSTTLASDIPIHREVGGSACHYFDTTRVDDLARLIGRHLSGELELVPSPSDSEHLPKIFSWRESFDQCWTELLASYQQRAMDKGWRPRVPLPKSKAA